MSLLAVAAVSAAFALISIFNSSATTKVWETVAVITSSGGLGGFLLKLDQKERDNIRYQQLLDKLIGLPGESVEKEKAIIDLIAKIRKP